WAAGCRLRMAPLSWATYASRVPKSVNSAMITLSLTPACNHGMAALVVVIAHLNTPLLRVTEVDGHAGAMRSPARCRPFLDHHTVRLEMVDEPWHVLFAQHHAKVIEVRAQWCRRSRDRFLEREQINYRIGVDTYRREPYLALPKLLKAFGLKTEYIGI